LHGKLTPFDERCAGTNVTNITLVTLVTVYQQEIFDTGKPSLETSFFLRDEGDKSACSEPVQLTL